MHDVTNLEGRGIPSVGVASTEFIEAAASQTKSLGFDAARVFVPHPIQGRTDSEIRSIADAAVQEIIANIVNRPA